MLEQFSVPFLILHGERDSLCAVAGSQLLYDKADVKDKKLKVCLYTKRNEFLLLFTND